MKILDTKGIYYLESAGNSRNWYWGEDYSSGDLYETEEVWNLKKKVPKNRLVMVRLPEGITLEPIEVKEGQYLGTPSYYHENQVYVVLADFKKEELYILEFDPDELLRGGTVRTLETIPLSEVKDCYNLRIDGDPVMLTRQAGDKEFQILWTIEDGRVDISFQIEDTESFCHREGEKLYFTSWWESGDDFDDEQPDYEYHEEVIVRNLQGEILERMEGGLMEVRPGEYYILR